MIDKVDKINFNNYNFPTPKGHYCVQLFDAETNELIREEHHDNMFNTELSRIFYEDDLYQLLNRASTRYRDTYYPASPKYLRLANFQVEPYPTLGYPSSMEELKAGRGYFVGSGEYVKTSNEDYHMSYNATESNVSYYLDDNGRFRKKVHWVFDAATNQCNGTISALFLSGDGSYGGRVFNFYYMSNNSSSYDCYIGLNPLIPGVPSWVANGNLDAGYTATTSIDDDGIIWLLPQGTTNSNWQKYDGVENIPTFFGFDSSSRYIGSQSLQLPSELLNTYIRGYKVGNKFFVMSFTSSSTSNNIAARDVYVFNSNGVYEGKAPTQIYYTPAGYFCNAIGTPFGLVYFNPTNGGSGYTSTGLQGGILGVNGNHLWLYQRADNVNNLDEADKYSGYPFFSVARDEGKWYVGIHHGRKDDNAKYRTHPLGYYDVETGKVFKAPATIMADMAPTYGYNPWYSDYSRYGITMSYEGKQTIAYQGGGLIGLSSNTFISWCKLDNPVTKTSNTTMKIQYDFDIPYHNYFTS